MTDQDSGIYHPNENDETCGVYLGAGFILGGNITKRGELPYQAALGYRGKKGKGNSYNCGGTLINRYVNRHKARFSKDNLQSCAY